MQIDLSDQHLLIISEALVQMPYFRAAPVLDSIRGQIAAQQAAKQADAKTAADVVNLTAAAAT